MRSTRTPTREPPGPQPLGATTPSAPLGRPAAPPAGAPLELARARARRRRGPTIAGSGVAMLDGPRDQFNAALQAFRAASSSRPRMFQGVPDHQSGPPATPDAVFYVGETYFQRSRPREAAEQYFKVTTDFSKSNRAPESMVRLGQTLAALGNKDQACATFGEFGARYPNATAP